MFVLCVRNSILNLRARAEQVQLLPLDPDPRMLIQNVQCGGDHVRAPERGFGTDGAFEAGKLYD